MREVDHLALVRFLHGDGNDPGRLLGVARLAYGRAGVAVPRCSRSRQGKSHREEKCGQAAPEQKCMLHHYQSFSTVCVMVKDLG
jgi:hypothetical protein